MLRFLKHHLILIIIKTGDYLLDNPFSINQNWQHFILEDTFPLRTSMLNKVIGIMNNGDSDKAHLEDFYTELLEEILTQQINVSRKIGSIDKIKVSTRQEIYRRLEVARGFIHDSFTRNIKLSEIASIACMSATQFSRYFKMVFHCTPHEYVVRLRINLAESLLKDQQLNVNEVCKKIGFENDSSFIRLFRQIKGVTPKQFRSFK